jgi:uncharacterized membrane protein YeaQ/YmgE (transglycosylase-associated protein family)
LSPSLTFSILLATLYGMLAHLILGGDFGALVTYTLAAFIGFAIGHGVGEVMDIRALSIGPTNVLTATLGSLIAIIALVFLSFRQDGSASRRRK